VFRYEDGDAATCFAEVAVLADGVPEALDLLARRGMHPEQLWDRGRTPCTTDGRGPHALADGEVLVRRHRQDGAVTAWEAPRAGLDRRRQARSRAAASTAQ